MRSLALINKPLEIASAMFVVVMLSRKAVLPLSVDVFLEGEVGAQKECAMLILGLQVG